MDKEFAEFQKKTSIKNFDLNYFCLGLCGEIGEVANEVKKIERDDNDQLTDERKNKIKNECGDVLWYLQGICHKLDCTIPGLMKMNIEGHEASVLSSIPLPKWKNLLPERKNKEKTKEKTSF